MPKLAKIYHFDSFWKRDEKYAQLDSWSIANIPWKELTLDEPYCFFVPKDFWATKKYEEWFIMDSLFINFNSWVETWDDNKLVWYSKIDLQQDLIEYSKLYCYKPFDIRYIPFKKDILHRSRMPLMWNMLYDNIGLIAKRWLPFNCPPVFLSRNPIDRRFFTPAWTQWAESIFPLYLYSDTENLDWETRTPNLDATIWGKINETVWETTPEQILDYIYAVLHSPTYRETYKEFLKIDFPRVAYPSDKANFLALVKLWTELRELHLLESPKVQNPITTYPVVGANEVTKVNFTSSPFEGEDWGEVLWSGDISWTVNQNSISDSSTSLGMTKGKVYINETQYFWDVPLVAWEFYIGGYQPAQKWLKDRKGRTLTWEDIEHYQQVIVALTETKRIMGDIDEVFII
jgi:hypothetical protein